MPGVIKYPPAPAPLQTETFTSKADLSPQLMIIPNRDRIDDWYNIKTQAILMTGLPSWSTGIFYSHGVIFRLLCVCSVSFYHRYGDARFLTNADQFDYFVAEIWV